MGGIHSSAMSKLGLNVDFDGPDSISAIPTDVLMEILLRVDDETLFTSVPLVCRTFHAILMQTSHFWTEMCLKKGHVLPPPTKRHVLDMRKIYKYNPFGRELINNPSGEEGLTGWELVKNGGDHWIVESPPVGSENNVDTCFATSYRMCLKQQIISVTSLALDSPIIQSLKPKVTVSEMTAARFDCGSQYEMHVRIVNKGGEILQNFDENVKTEQWLGSKWSTVKHTFNDLNPDADRLIFESGGCDLQSWAGHYGPKTANASVIIHF